MSATLYEIAQAAGFDPLVQPVLNLEPYIMLVDLVSARAAYDPFEWGNRTLANAHQHIVQNWDSLTSGDVLDVEYILGEKETCKASERITAPL